MSSRSQGSNSARGSGSTSGSGAQQLSGGGALAGPSFLPPLDLKGYLTVTVQPIVFRIFLYATARLPVIGSVGYRYLVFSYALNGYSRAYRLI